MAKMKKSYVIKHNKTDLYVKKVASSNTQIEKLSKNCKSWTPPPRYSRATNYGICISLLISCAGES